MDKIFEILCRGFDKEDLRIVRVFVLVFPVMYTMLDMQLPSFGGKTLVAQCMYAACLSIVFITICAVSISVFLRRAALLFPVSVFCVVLFFVFANGVHVMGSNRGITIFCFEMIGFTLLTCFILQHALAIPNEGNGQNNSADNPDERDVGKEKQDVAKR